MAGEGLGVEIDGVAAAEGGWETGPSLDFSVGAADAIAAWLVGE